MRVNICIYKYARFFLAVVVLYKKCRSLFFVRWTHFLN